MGCGFESHGAYRCPAPLRQRPPGLAWAPRERDTRVGQPPSEESSPAPLDYPTLPGDIDHLIADDHAIVERQFQHLEAGRGNRRVLVDQISFELALHAFAEETVLYPIWPEIGMTDEHEDAEHEHQQIKDLLVVL